MCTVLTSAAQKFNVEDYVLVEFRGVQHNSVTEKDDVTTITGLSDVFPYKPVKDENAKPTQEPAK